MLTSCTSTLSYRLSKSRPFVRYTCQGAGKIAAGSRCSTSCSPWAAWQLPRPTTKTTLVHYNRAMQHLAFDTLGLRRSRLWPYWAASTFTIYNNLIWLSRLWEQPCDLPLLWDYIENTWMVGLSIIQKAAHRLLRCGAGSGGASSTSTHGLVAISGGQVWAVGVTPSRSSSLKP